MWLFRRKGASGFSSSSTAEEVTHGIDGSGLTAIVTGASSGIGSETSRVLALRGVHVIMAVRNMTAGKDVRDAIVKEIPAAKVDTMELDLSSLASVKKFASEFKSSGRPLNLLMNHGNSLYALKRQHRAAICHKSFRYELFVNEYSIERTLDKSIKIGHFLLTNLLLDKMKETARKTKSEGRIVNVSSEGHRFAYSEGIRFDRINDPKSYGSYGAYGQSKLANILHANELTRRLKEDGVDITANSLHPGTITTNLFRHMGIFNGFVGSLGKLMLKNVPQGASTTCYVALNPQVKGVSGEYFSDNNLATPSAMAKDMDLAKRLWDFSMDLVK
ncbi:Short-chain dehydrogenase TIC 32, chloroplastic [Capsicum annuum]|nr:Short-chain dehydrogenase TIC 32, chloroplastic [Capsicum annuum]